MNAQELFNQYTQKSKLMASRGGLSSRTYNLLKKNGLTDALTGEPDKQAITEVILTARIDSMNGFGEQTIKRLCEYVTEGE